MTVSSNNEKVMLSAVRTLRRRLRKALRATNCAMVMLALSAKTLSSRHTPLSWVKTFYAVRKLDALRGAGGLAAPAQTMSDGRKAASRKAFGGSRSYKDLTTR